MLIAQKNISYNYFHTALKVEFSKASYNGSESSGNITVTLLLKGGTTAINITVTVTPSNLLPPSAKGKSCVYPTMTSYC